ncbi:hypothetical protein [Salipaludibacillus sp. CF4.18]|uniref:hypothetical protein n=1 Tax=Salipaludibacillus sp. CF4.18 TaxID=3373081 RepID=UPI003EE48875
MNDIILGDGVFSIGVTDVGLTRGGGMLTIEREYRNIEADGDYGPVKGRIRKIRSVAKLSMNSLEILASTLPKMYPAVENTTDLTTDTITAKTDIEDADYNDTITWTGKTTSGRSVVITLENALNLESIEWDLKDKEEVVPETTYTATYLEGTTDVEPWKIVFTDAV